MMSHRRSLETELQHTLTRQPASFPVPISTSETVPKESGPLWSGPCAHPQLPGRLVLGVPAQVSFPRGHGLSPTGLQGECWSQPVLLPEHPGPSTHSHPDPSSGPPSVPIPRPSLPPPAPRAPSSCLVLTLAALRQVQPSTWRSGSLPSVSQN